MKYLNSISIERINLQSVAIRWRFGAVFNSTMVDIYRRKNSIDDTYEKIGSSMGVSYIDLNAPLAMRIDYQYKLVFREESTDWISPGDSGDNYTYAIASNILWGMTNCNIGQEINVYSVLDSDETCPECFDTILHKIIKSNCTQCNGSGKKTSYWGPIRSYMKSTGVSPSEEYYGDVMINVKKPAALMPNFPVVHKTDIIEVCSTKERYVVDEAPAYGYISTESGDKFIYKQNIKLRLLQNNDAAYRIGLNG